MIYAVGDIHGQAEKLRDLLGLLEDAGMSRDDVVVFVGDYVDRGPDVAGVLEQLIRFRGSHPNAVFLRGNHEQMMLDARQRSDPEFDNDNTCENNLSGRYWFPEGGLQTMRSYGSPNGRRWFELVPESHWEFIRSTRMEFEAGAYWFAHAGLLPPGVEWVFTEFAADPRLWIRYEFIGNQSDFGGKTVVFGHTPTKDGLPLFLWNKIAIDTGAGFGAPLTAVGLPNRYDRDEVVVWQAE